MFFASPPDDDTVRSLLHQRSDSPFTYTAVGSTKDSSTVVSAEFTLDSYGCELGRGRDTYVRAKEALQRFDHYPRSFTRVVRDVGPLVEGHLFGTVVTHMGFASLHPCRVIYTVDEADRFGFGFGSLPGHAESGEERFTVSLADDVVRYDVLAFSKPTGLVPRLGAPVTRLYQLRFQRETLEAMRAVSAPGTLFSMTLFSVNFLL